MSSPPENNPAVKPFTVSVPDATLGEIKSRVENYPWHEMPDDGGWNYGTNLNYLKKFCDYWIDKYDWRAAEARINAFSNYKTEIDGIDLHFIYEKGSGDNPRPLMISHGWPGSVVEFLNVIEPLAHPERFGGNPSDAFTVIAPSLPGFGYSGRPPRPIGTRKIASIYNTLLTDTLGFENYMAQGGDWGSGVSTWLGYDHAPACAAVHLNFFSISHPDGPQTANEVAWAKRFAKNRKMHGGYLAQQSTRPQSLSYAMMDSPVGIAGWIIEKFHDWSAVPEGEIGATHDIDDLITNIMVYITTRTFNTASWIYYGQREEGGFTLPDATRRIELPVGCALFPAEMPWPPRSFVERVYNIVHWTEMPRGGHFAAMEQPDLLVEDIRAFARKHYPA